MAYDVYYNNYDRLHPRITKNNLIRRLKWLLNGQNSSAVLHPTKMNIIRNTITKIQEQNSNVDAYEVFSRGFSWHPDALSPVETQFESEYNKVLGKAIVDKYAPEIFGRNRNDDEFIIKEVIFGRPLNRFAPTKTVISPIPTFEEAEAAPRQTLEEICVARAAEIKTKANGRNIYLLWSGGIDSTLALHSLDQGGLQFTVIFDKESMDEYDELSTAIIDGEYPNISIEFDPTPGKYGTILDDANNYIVTGGNGDEIFGGEPNCSGEIENADQDHTLYIPSYILNSTNDYVKQLVGIVNMQDLNVCEWRWAINFIYRYQQIQISTMYMLGLDMVNARPGHDAIHFYDTSAFQLWSVQNFRSLCGVGEDKMVAKELIYKYDNCDRYLENKVKVCSMKKTKYRSGLNYMGTGGDVNTDIGKSYSNTYATTITLDKEMRLLQPGTMALALQKFDGV